jgi:AraC-like DNA-binding protein
MGGAHRHDDIEVNLVAEAPLTYLFGGTPVRIRPGEVGVFWAAMPHRLVDCVDNWNSYVCWLHVPLDIVLKWGLPEDAMSRLLRGSPIVSTLSGERSLGPTDFSQWAKDFSAGDGEPRDIALLEIQAWIRRLVRVPSYEQNAESRDWSDADEAVRLATEMARYAATRFRDPITVADIAGSVHLHPNYAMTLFRRVVGTTLGSYLLQCRLAEAQRLLITTAATITDVAAATGFGSHSAFYAAFTRACGQPPGAYRRSYR